MITKITANKLIEINLCIDNEYLHKYIELINNNINTKRKLHETAKHHIVPRYYFKDKNTEVDNSENNIVNLKYTDHILAHYYLALCSATVNYKFDNENALVKMCCRKDKPIDEIWINNNAEFLNELFIHRGQLQSELCKGRLVSEETRKKLSNSNRMTRANKEYKQIHLGEINKAVPTTELADYLSQGWQLGKSSKLKQSCGGWNRGQHTSEDSKKKQAAAKLGRVHIYRNNEEKLIPEIELENHLTDGWCVGRSENTKEIMKASCVGIKKDHFKGKHQTEDAKISIGKHNSGGKYVHKNGISKHISEDDIEKYLADGWELGSLSNANKEPRCWVYNDNGAIQIMKKEIDYYLAQGYNLGRKNNKYKKV